MLETLLNKHRKQQKIIGIIFLLLSIFITYLFFQDPNLTKSIAYTLIALQISITTLSLSIYMLISNNKRFVNLIQSPEKIDYIYESIAKTSKNKDQFPVAKYIYIPTPFPENIEQEINRRKNIFNQPNSRLYINQEFITIPFQKAPLLFKELLKTIPAQKWRIPDTKPTSPQKQKHGYIIIFPFLIVPLLIQAIIESQIYLSILLLIILTLNLLAIQHLHKSS